MGTFLKRKEEGFTLIEVMITIAVITVALVAMIGATTKMNLLSGPLRDAGPP